MPNSRETSPTRDDKSKPKELGNSSPGGSPRPHGQDFAARNPEAYNYASQQGAAGHLEVPRAPGHRRDNSGSTITPEKYRLSTQHKNEESDISEASDTGGKPKKKSIRDAYRAEREKAVNLYNEFKDFHGKNMQGETIDSEDINNIGDEYDKLRENFNKAGDKKEKLRVLRSLKDANEKLENKLMTLREE